MARQPKVQMPEPDYRNRGVQNYRNGVLIPQFGEATVRAAEMTAVMDVMIMAGIVRPQEMMDLIERRCHQIDQQRREAARLESDRG